MSSAEKEREFNISQHDKLVISEILEPNPPTSNAHSKRALAHPNVGGKQPKKALVLCVGKKILEDQLRDARQEVERL